MAWEMTQRKRALLPPINPFTVMGIALFAFYVGSALYSIVGLFI